jgi:ABC-type branched-subunit amino acid transport system substrate-binding protein
MLRTRWHRCPSNKKVVLFTDALSRAGSMNSAKIDTAISQTDTQTTAGPITFNRCTHTAITPYYITQWQHAKLVQLQPLAHGVTFQLPVAGLA